MKVEGFSLEKTVFAVRAVPESVVSKQVGGTHESSISSCNRMQISSTRRMNKIRFQVL